MRNQPSVSVIIPLKSLSYYLIFESLPALAKQSYRKFEVIVLPNEQVQYDLTLLRKYKFLRIIPTGKVTRPAQKRDLGVEQAKGEIIAFIDDDAFPSERWLEYGVKSFGRKDVAAVCGPGVLPQTADFWEKAVDGMMRSWIGSGSYRYRFLPEKKRFVDDYPSMNFLIKKNIFQKLGGFNNDYWPGEDSKLCNDLVYVERQKILYDPRVLVYHHRRKNLVSHLKQHANYGFHRGAFLAHGDENSRRFSYFVPTLFYTYLVLYLFFFLSSFVFAFPKILVYIFCLPVVMYLGAMVYLLLRSFFHSRSLKVGLGSVITLVLTHMIYAVMFVRGFFKGLQTENIYDKG